jgi:hypothetical protein
MWWLSCAVAAAFSGTTIKLCLAEGTVTNVVYQKSFPTKKPQETMQIALDLY